MISPKIYNEFAPGNKPNGSYHRRAAACEFNAFGHAVDARRSIRNNWQYPHNCGVPASDGDDQQRTAVLRDDDRKPRHLIPVAGFHAPSIVTSTPGWASRSSNPHVYIGVGYIWGSTNYGYPNMNAVGLAVSRSCPIGGTLHVLRFASATIRTSRARIPQPLRDSVRVVRSRLQPLEISGRPRMGIDPSGLPGCRLGR